jgi:hypothetical protein
MSESLKGRDHLKDLGVDVDDNIYKHIREIWYEVNTFI